MQQDLVLGINLAIAGHIQDQDCDRPRQLLNPNLATISLKVVAPER